MAGKGYLKKYLTSISLKALIIVVIYTFIVMAFFSGMPSFVSAVDLSVSAPVSTVSVIVNGKPLLCDQPPIIINDRTMVPLRAIFEAMGATVSWDGDTRIVTGRRGNITVTLKIDEENAMVNGKTIVLDSPAVIKGGRTLVPVRFVAESLEAVVDWDGIKRMVTINGKTVYDLIMRAIFEVSDRVSLSAATDFKTMDYDYIFDILDKVLRDHPDIFYFSYEGSVYWSDGSFDLTYSNTKAKITSMKEELQNKIKSIVNTTINAGMTDYEKEKVLHDYLVKNAYYDLGNKSNGVITDLSFTAYGVLIKGFGVCEGYSEAMKLLLGTAGIECLVVYGETDGVGHAWNIVKIGGAYYHLDVTWDDPIPDISGQVSYIYFNLPDKEILSVHNWDIEDYPACSETKYNYYSVNDLVVVDYSQFYNTISKAISESKSIVNLRVENYSSTIYDVSETIKKINEDNKNLGLFVKSWSWSVNEEFGIVDINNITYTRLQ